MFCTECGTDNPDTNRFCRSCGKPLKTARPSPPQAGPAPGPSAVPSPAGPPAGTMAGAAGAQRVQAGPSGQSLMSVDEFRKMSKEVPLKKRPQRWWDLLCIIGGITAAAIWFVYGSLREGIDWLSCILMIAIPLMLVWLRVDLDKMILPLQPAKKRVPRIVLIGIGIVIPFLTAWILYNIFNISQYPLMQANLVAGTLAAYVVTRTPKVPAAQQQQPGGAVHAALLIAGAIILVSLIAVPVIADDCTRDPLNAQDCLRTGGFAEAMAGLIAAILSGLVNGPIIIQGILQGGGGSEEETEEGEGEEDEGGVSLRLTFPAGRSPRVFTEGWLFGASATIGEKDVSDSVRWGGSGTFSPDVGRLSRPSFSAPGPNQIILTVATEKGDVTKTFTVNAVDPVGRYARVTSLAKCDADAHGCPACPHPVVGPIISGSSTVFSGGRPAARVGDAGVHHACCGPNQYTVITGDPSVLIDGRPAAIVGSSIANASTTRHCGGTGFIFSW